MAEIISIKAISISQNSQHVSISEQVQFIELVFIQNRTNKKIIELPFDKKQSELLIDLSMLNLIEAGKYDFYVKIANNKLKLFNESSLKDRISNRFFELDFFADGVKRAVYFTRDGKMSFVVIEDNKYSNMFKKTGDISINTFSIKGATVSFALNDVNISPSEVYLRERSLGTLYPLKYTSLDNQVLVDFTEFTFTEEIERVLRFDLIVDYFYEGILESRTVKLRDEEIRSDWQRYYHPVQSFEGSDRQLIPYFTKLGNLSFVFRKWLYVNTEERNTSFKGQLDEVANVSGDILRFTVNFQPIFPEKHVQINNLTLAYRGNDFGLDIQPSQFKILKTDAGYQLQADFLKTKIASEIRGDSYVIVVHTSIFEDELIFQIKEISEKFYKQMHKKLRDVFAINNEKKLLIQLGLTGTLFMHYRDLHKVDLPSVREREAYALSKYKPNKRNGNILMFEKESQMAQDNAFALFKYLQHTTIAKKVFYVIDEDSAQFEKLQPWMDQVLPLFSEKYFQHLIEDQMIVSSESLPHIYQFNMNSGNIIDILRTKNNYMLQHGVVGIRKLGGVFINGVGGFDFFNTSTKHEKQIVIDLLKYNPDHVPILGLPRWDDLNERITSNTIVFFPTWRENLAYLDDSEFVLSDYYKSIMDFLTNKQLLKLLQDSSYTLKVFLHPKMREFSSQLATDHNAIIITDSSSESLSDLIKSTDMIISDYSSVVWDFAYQRKPVLLYQFDQAQYEKQLGGFFDTTIWKFGPISNNVDGLLNDLEQMLYHRDSYFSNYRDYMDELFDGLVDINETHTQFIVKQLMRYRTDTKKLTYTRLYPKPKMLEKIKNAMQLKLRSLD